MRESLEIKNGNTTYSIECEVNTTKDVADRLREFYGDKQIRANLTLVSNFHR